MPEMTTWISGRCGSARACPSIVRHGLNHPRPEVDDACLGAADAAIVVAVLDVDAVDEHAVESAVLLDEVGTCFDPGEPAIRVFDGVRRQLRVQAGQSMPKAAFEHDIAVAGAFGQQLAGCDFGTVGYLPADAFQPGECRLSDREFGEGAHVAGIAGRDVRFVRGPVDAPAVTVLRR